MTQPIHVLYVDDNRLDRELVRDALEKEHGGFCITEAASRPEFEARLAEGGYDLVLTDFDILGFEGLEVIDAVHALDPTMPVVIVTGTGSEEVAAEAMRRGAADYVIKTPHHIRRLPFTVQRVLEKRGLDDERRRAEEALRQSEEFNRRIIESSHDCIKVLDLEGRLLFVSPGRQALLEIEDIAAYLGTPWVDFWQGADHKAAGEAIAEATRGGVGAFRGYCPTAKGTPKWWDVLITPIADAEGNPERLLAISRDVSERIRAEEALKAYSERLEEMVEERTRELGEAHELLVRREKLAVLGLLAGGVSHELRNPLGAIKNAAYLLNLILAERETDPDVVEALGILTEEVGTCERIISSLLDFARPRPLVPREVDVNDVVQEALARAHGMESQLVEVVCQLDETLPAIRADAGQLVQVFGNLIANAIQAMPEGGRLDVRSQLAGAGWVAVSFVDSGVGISEENLGKLFEPLFTTKAKGIGLGLAVIQALVEGHGGSIEVESQVGQGSTFTVRLPAGKEEGA